MTTVIILEGYPSEGKVLGIWHDAFTRGDIKDLVEQETGFRPLTEDEEEQENGSTLIQVNCYSIIVFKREHAVCSL